MALENVHDIYPVSPMQAGMLFHTIESPDPGLYVLQIRVTLDGPLQWDVLIAAWDDVVHRHDALRAVFVWEELDEPLQVIQERVATPWERLDARRLVAEGGPGALDAWMEDDRRRGFDLKEAPLMRVTLLQLDDQRHRLVWTLHHLLADAWSVGVVLDELKGAYHARLGGHPFAAGPPPAYRDFIACMKDRPDGDAEAAWRRSLEGFRERISVDLPRPTAREAGPRKRRFHEARLPPSAAEALAGAARACRVTPATLYQAAWARVLGDYARTSDVVFGLVVSGRSNDLPGAERAVGLYMNTVPARWRLGASPTLRELVEARHAESLALRPHENVSLGRIQAWSEVPAGSPLFDTLLIVENHPAPSAGGLDVLAFRDVDPMDQSNYPLAGFVIPGDGLRLLVLFDPEVVATDAAERLLGQFVAALEALPSHLDAPPSSLPLLSPSERDQLEAWARGPALADPEQAPLHLQIADLARKQPESTALVCGDRSLTYGEMEERAVAWARRLVGQGVGRGDRVALLVDRGCEMVVAMLASLKAGAAYVPFDTSYPSPRIGQVLDDCQPRMILTTRGHEGLAARHTIPTLFLDDKAEGAVGALSDVDGRDPAYVMYTSGSTGRPKGVVISHDSLSWSTRARPAVYGHSPACFLLLSSFAFDSSVAGLYWTLAAGGTLVISEPGLESDVERLGACLARHGVTHILCLPSLWEVVLDLIPPDRLASLRTVVVAGEAAPAGLIGRHRAVLPGVSLFNEYGPTEACVWCTVSDASELDADDPLPIGRPVPGAEVRLLTPEGRLAPPGAVGEIGIGGPGLAREYLGQPEATAQAFVTPEAIGRRLYRSGDLGRYRGDGTLEFLGRRDHQVKIRGHRIETAEVEEALRRHPEVGDAVVAAAPAAGETGRLALAAFVTSSREAPLSPGPLREYLRARLPAFMTPASLAVVESFPRLPNGKVDLEALLRSRSGASSPGPGPAAPRDDFERTLVEVWQEALGAERVGVRDDFFALGGDSLTSIRIVALARQRGVTLAPSEIFDFPSIAELAEHRAVGREESGDVGGRVLPSSGAVSGEGASLFMVHGGRRMLMQLTERLREDRPVHLLLDHRDAGDVAPFATVDALAEEYLDAIRDLQAEPPVFLGGYSIGAPVAVEMARRLKADGHPPRLLFLLDPPDEPSNFKSVEGVEWTAPARGGSAGPRPPHDGPGRPRAREGALSHWSGIAAGVASRLLGRETPLGVRRRYVPWVYDRALRRHVLRPYGGPVVVFHSADARRNGDGLTLWQLLEGEHAETVNFEAAHTAFVRDPDVIDRWTRCLAERLATAESGRGCRDAAADVASLSDA